MLKPKGIREYQDQVDAYTDIDYFDCGCRVYYFILRAAEWLRDRAYPKPGD